MIFWSFVLDFLGNYSLFSGKKSQPPPFPAHKWPGTPESGVVTSQHCFSIILETNEHQNLVRLRYSLVEDVTHEVSEQSNKTSQRVFLWRYPVIDVIVWNRFWAGLILSLNDIKISNLLGQETPKPPINGDGGGVSWRGEVSYYSLVSLVEKPGPFNITHNRWYLVT